MIEKASQVAYGSLMGAMYGYWGFKKLGKGEKMSGRKLIRATLAGAVSGGLAAYLGIPLQDGEDIAFNGVWSFGLAFALDQAAIRLWRILKPKKALPLPPEA